MFRYSFFVAFTFLAISAFGQTETGLASYYNDKFQGSQTASGEPYDKDLFTAAHKTLPFGTIVKVTRTDNGKTVIVKINDKGPYYKGMIIELSRKAAETIDLVKDGTTTVKIEVQTPKSYDVKTKKKAAASQKIDINTPKGKAEGLYKVESTKVSAKGYAVQIGIFSDYKNVLNQADILRKNGVKDILIWIDDSQKGKEIYRVMAGPYEKLGNASAAKSNLRRKGSQNASW